MTTQKPHTEPRPHPDHDAPWPLWKLGLLLYPFVLLAVWINLFMLALIGTWLGLGSLSPVSALLAALVIALPADYAAALWLRSLLDRAAG
ncbi:hypothetical protein [Paracoccus aerodenitrificans]|uniref:hypothetical protein n=1 Tax=Paracoccus aerodenitrificans TaxID=3017781 RepID=UPI0022F0BEAC|nr:hypothetical protein [Paracoccus aerodenitrificans]WBU62785.1 hypothetical protein PAE61_10400 [Paracoccus aerodenitrificans]